MIRAVVTARESLDIGQVASEGKILICDIPVYAPLRADDVKLLGRLLINDVLGHIFSRAPGHARPSSW